MPQHEILRMGDRRLTQIAQPVREPDWASIPQLIIDMQDTMIAYDGTGLAAPQMGVDLRVVIFEVAGGREGAYAVPLTVLINPQIEILDDTLESGVEGCLSVPGMRGFVDRYRRIRYSGVDEQRQPVDRTADGFHARVVQHEVDHLDGLLYPMRIKDLRQFGFADLVPGE